ncbi:hypothetical protein [Halomonas sp. NO4]|uniref:hypothetical protein n=1 Tax=Halomonas sp. NO4 TaxID=2484813 RepID=UPI0013D04687|nr:hypothetical protein [Halomonas sp. NO4]
MADGGIIIEAIQAGGNLGLLLMGLALMRTNARVTRLELARELEREQRRGH